MYNEDEEDYFMVDYGSTTPRPPPVVRDISPEAVVTQPPTVDDVDALERGEAVHLRQRSFAFFQENAAWGWHCCAACAQHLHGWLPCGEHYQRVSRVEA